MTLMIHDPSVREDADTSPAKLGRRISAYVCGPDSEMSRSARKTLL